MQGSEARVPTDKASRYMTQLCKHWAHKFPVEHSEAQGSIALPAGTCRMEAQPETLVLRVEAPDETQLSRLEEVVARHLERFMFREPPQIEWRRALSPASNP